MFTIIYATFLVYYLGKNKTLKLLNISQTIILFITFIFSYLYPHISYDSYYNELLLSSSFASKNNLAAVMAFGILTGYILITSKDIIGKSIKTIAFFNIVFSSFLLFKAGSSTSIIICIVPIVIYKVLSVLKFKFNYIYILLAIHIITYTIVSGGEKINQFLEKYFHRNITLTGRVDIWKSALYAVKQKPFFGYGYGGFWGFNNEIENHIFSINGGEFVGSHNGFIELLLYIGIIGVILFIILVILLGYRTKYIYKNSDISIKIPTIYISYILIYFITERSFGALNYQTLIIYLSVIFIDKCYYKVKKERNS
ncbi:O-antigen ligase family protein [Clostridium perfringens]|nr:O-antigen ligase family protein [Clostridium perfringens]HAT4257868.1 hypothetical protein [Clostridium perfringens]